MWCYTEKRHAVAPKNKIFSHPNQQKILPTPRSTPLLFSLSILSIPLPSALSKLITGAHLNDPAPHKSSIFAPFGAFSVLSSGFLRTKKRAPGFFLDTLF